MEVQDAVDAGDSYEVPTLVEVGTVRQMTQGHLFAAGHDFLSFIPIPGLFGSH